MTDSSDLFDDGHLTWLSLSAHEDGELAPPENALVDGHLAECATCRAELERLRTTTALDTSAERALPTPPSERRATAIAAALEEFDRRRTVTAPRRGRPAAATSGIAAALVLVVGLVVGLVVLHHPGAGSSGSINAAGGGGASRSLTPNHAAAGPAAQRLVLHFAPLVQIGRCPLHPPAGHRRSLTLRTAWAGPQDCARVGRPMLTLPATGVSELAHMAAGQLGLHLSHAVTLPPHAVVIVGSRVVGRASSAYRAGSGNLLILSDLTPAGSRLVQETLGR